MLKQIIIILTLTFVLILTPGCDNCNYNKCKLNGGFVELRLLRNGENAVFGPSAFIDQNSIQYSNLKPTDPAALIDFNDTSRSIKLFIEDIYSYELTLGSVRTDTLSGITTVVDYDGCCPFYELVTIYWNGEEICINECGGIIEIEI